MSPPRRILIVRTSALGDIVHGLPVVRALKRDLPESRIGWVVESRFETLIDTYEGIDQTIAVDTKGWRQRPWAADTLLDLARLRRELRDFDADVALDLMGNHKGALLARLSGARQRIGLERQARREPSSALWINQPVDPLGEHAIERALSVLAPLGVEPAPVDLGGEQLLLETPAEVRAEIDGESQPFILIHPGAGWGNKEYPPASWGEVAQHLHQQLDVAIRVVTSPFEAEIARRAVAHSDGCLGLAQAPNLPALAAWLRAALLVIGGDTGPLHMAHALGTEVLFLMGPTDPARHGPYRAADHVLVDQLPCSFCYKRFDETKACLANLRPAAIADRVRSILEAS